MKLKLLIIGLVSIFFFTGCNIKTNSLENAKIYTTIYPTQYIIDYLYGEDSEIESIYPIDVNLEAYELTDKQIENYAAGDLFVYIGLGKEKDIAKKLLNKNDELLIIDATYGLNYNVDIMELWLAPNNFLMLVKNIRNSLNEYLDNSFKKDDVNKKYDELYENVSWIDAELRNISRDAIDNDNNTIVVSSNIFKYLESYGFNIISLEEIETSGSENAINDIKAKFKNSTYTKILKLNSEEDTELMTELKEKNKASIVTLNDLITNSDTASDYISIQYENIAVIRDYLND